MRRFLFLSLTIAVLAAAALGLLRWTKHAAHTSSRQSTLLVIGIDGGERRVIESLWRQGKLPNLRRIADAGVMTTLHTAYNSSPVIWTTIATGVRPSVHGITDFVVATPQGDVPISSDLRKVPALWNMLSRVGRRVAVLGWWGSWPAEEVNGWVVSDRLLLNLDRRVYPPAQLPRLLNIAKAAGADSEDLFVAQDEAQVRDRAIARTAVALAREDLDLLMVYFRSTDIVSHNAWKCWEPEAFPPMDPRELAACRDAVPRVYEAVDAAIGRIRDAAPHDANVVVLSDHGFHAARREEVKVFLDMDTVLARLGYLQRNGPAIDFTRTLVYTYATPDFRRPKLLRFALTDREPAGRVKPEQREEIRRRLTADLSRVTYAAGAPVFLVRDARPREAAEGADLVAGVSTEGATRTLCIDGEPFQDAVSQVARLSGTHTENTHGVLLAAGPSIDAEADPRLAGIHVNDIAPTLLYGLGLPVAEDFAGRAWTELYTAEFRDRHPLRTIRSWGVRRNLPARTSAADEKLLRELRALGYIN
jgi:predicted AlkP superfamily phosphohydrolase/phosphomutase